jgi:hypothetical protein
MSEDKEYLRLMSEAKPKLYLGWVWYHSDLDMLCVRIRRDGSPLEIYKGRNYCIVIDSQTRKLLGWNFYGPRWHFYNLLNKVKFWK